MNHSQSLLYRLLVGFPMICLLAAILFIARHQNQQIADQQANHFTFEQSSFVVKGTASSDTIEYEKITDCYSTEQLHFQKNTYKGEAYFNGDFVFKEIGDARGYFYPNSKPYIVIQTARKTYVVNEATPEKTGQLYEQIKEHMESASR